jgi:hypothetical protein
VPVLVAAVALLIAPVSANACDERWTPTVARRLTLSSILTVFVKVGFCVDQLLLDELQGQAGQGWLQVHVLYVSGKQPITFIILWYNTT